MAETTIPGPSKRGTIITLQDATGSPKTYVINHGEAQPKFKDPTHEEVWAMTADGDYLPTVRKGNQSAPATIDLSGCRMFDAGGNTSEGVLADIALGKGYFASTWTSSETGSEFMCFQTTIRIPQNIAGTQYTQYVWTDCHVQPGAEIDIQPGKITIGSLIIAAPGAATVTKTT